VPFISRRPTLRLAEEEATWLRQLSPSRSEPAGRVQRAEMLLRYHGGQTVSGIAASLRTNRPRVERCLAKALELGVHGALQDLPGRGRRRTLSAEARAWAVALACQKPKELGYAQELWTTRLLAQPSVGTVGPPGNRVCSTWRGGRFPTFCGRSRCNRTRSPTIWSDATLSLRPK